MFGQNKAAQYLPDLFARFIAAERIGPQCVEETYQNALDKWKDNLNCFSDIAIILEQLLWNHYCGDEEMPVCVPNDIYIPIYSRLYQDHCEYAKQHLNRKDYHYFCQIIE